MKLAPAAALVAFLLLVPQALGGENDSIERQILELAQDITRLERDQVKTKRELAASPFSSISVIREQNRRRLAILDENLADRRKRLERVIERRIDVRLASDDGGRDVPGDLWLYGALGEKRGYVYALEGRSLGRRLAAATDPMEIAQLKRWIDRRHAILPRLLGHGAAEDHPRQDVDETVQAKGVVINTFGGERSNLPPKELSIGEANALARRESLARIRRGLRADSDGVGDLDSHVADLEEILRTYDRAREAWFSGRRGEAERLAADAGVALDIAEDAAKRDAARWAQVQAPAQDESGRVSIHAEEAAIRQVLMSIGPHAPVGITWPADLYGRVTLDIEDLPWRQALDLVLAAVGWEAVEDHPPTADRLGSLRLVRRSGGPTEATTLQSLHEEIRALRREVQEIKRILLSR